MQTDTQIRTNVEAELRWSPDLDEKDIAAKIENGVVTLSGFVPSYVDKSRAESAVKRVAGVTAVANDIQVRIPSQYSVSDPEIARNVATVIRLQLPFASDAVKAIVTNGFVTLEGEVVWHYQREGIESAVRHLKGVVGVSDQVRIKPRVVPSDIKHRIEEAFRRSAEVDSKHVSVAVSEGEVILSGKVRSWAERDEAQMTAWAAPGVTRVTNNIMVGL